MSWFPLYLLTHIKYMSKKIIQFLQKNAILSVGLDVAKNKIDICLLGNNQQCEYFQIKNTRSDIQKCITFFEENNIPKNIPYIIESTWDYNTLACILFAKAKFSIKEINPLITKKYIKSSIRGTKTDKTDAKALAMVGIIEGENLPNFSKELSFLGVSKKISLIAKLETVLQSLQQALKSYKENGESLEMQVYFSQGIKDLEKNIFALKEQIKVLQKEIEDISDFPEKVQEKIEILQSIKGISRYIACVIFFTCAHKNFVSKKQMYAFIWFDPRLRESGVYSWRARISKRGNPYLRKKLYQAGFCSIKHCQAFREIYESAKERGKHHFTSVICVIKKMVHIMFSLLKNNTYFNENLI